MKKMEHSPKPIIQIHKHVHRDNPTEMTHLETQIISYCTSMTNINLVYINKLS